MTIVTFPPLTKSQVGCFERDGFVVCPSLASPVACGKMRRIAEMHLSQLIAPVEYEVDVLYPGGPSDPDEPGGRTSRRLLQAFARDEVFREWSTSEILAAILAQLFASGTGVMLSQCHHNCIMTKSPGFSSATLWHQDVRYWSFDHENLISVWLALGTEDKSNGCLRVIPGSHLMELERGRLDASLFLRPELAQNKDLLQKVKVIELSPGDVLFFHARLFHAAGRNLTEETKLSPVFTYHEADNLPIEGTRSAKYPSIRVSV